MALHGLPASLLLMLHTHVLQICTHRSFVSYVALCAVGCTLWHLSNVAAGTGSCVLLLQLYCLIYLH